nr:hypothetical protein [uncultured Flavobacterium sp.]
MGIKKDKIDAISLLMATNNPAIIKKVREILKKGLNKKASSKNKIKKDIK